MSSNIPRFTETIGTYREANPTRTQADNCHERSQERQKDIVATAPRPQCADEDYQPAAKKKDADQNRYEAHVALSHHNEG